MKKDRVEKIIRLELHEGREPVWTACVRCNNANQIRGKEFNIRLELSADNKETARDEALEPLKLFHGAIKDCIKELENI